jgi:hypothetical protein
VGEHHFLAEEFIPGRTLNSCIVERHPLGSPAAGPAAAEEYTAWALLICDRVARAAAVMHERGLVFNDLHMFNVMVRPDDTVAFIDFEAASDASAGRTRTVGNPGFAAPRGRTGADVDAYSLACLRLAMFLPLTTLFPLDRGKPARLAAEIARLFPVPGGFLDEAVREITRGPARPDGQARPDADGTRLAVTARESAGAAPGDASGRARWDQLAADMVRAIRASATPDRGDRLFPGDIDQFRVTGGGLGLAHGAAGVLYALSQAAGVRVPEYEEWLATHAVRPPPGTRLGLYSGLAGVAYTLARLGKLDAAVAVARRCLGERWHRLGHDLYDGLSGFALAMMSVGDRAGEPELSAAGMRAAEAVAAPYLQAQAGAAVPRAAGGPGGPVGLLRGASGKALLFIRMYERTGDPGYLDAAEGAIAADLAQCLTDRHGALQVDDNGRRTLPYVGGGSAGIGMVIDQYTAHRGNDALADAARGIRLAANSGFYVQAGLFNGRAGMIACLASARDAGQAGDDGGREAAARGIGTHVDRLGWHAVRYGGGLAFPGDMLLRLSMDLGTGTAGVLLGAAAALAPDGAALPFFARPARLPARATGDSRRPLREPMAPKR